ncbi:hypothetical protein EVAR_25410_1 [Eumeta japonica]|uniref:Uncharacterized protein n=1 Tax=Eumeta variegata TaxID=151549 RepID=A0A4C1V5D7_EUMVA|nr:hypothetical protein EVAR_25410_1 [Eumeta japonica]
MCGISIKLRVVTEYAGRSGARRMARVFGSTHARRTACVGSRGRRARPQRLMPEVFAVVFELALAGDLMIIVVSWRPIPLRHAEACAVGRCRESTISDAPERLPSAVGGPTVMRAADIYAT